MIAAPSSQTCSRVERSVEVCSAPTCLTPPTVINGAPLKGLRLCGASCEGLEMTRRLIKYAMYVDSTRRQVQPA